MADQVQSRGLIAYFSSHKFKGVGQRSAEKILDTLGNRAFATLFCDPQAITAVGLPKKQETSIINKFNEIRSFDKDSKRREIVLVSMMAAGMTINLASRVMAEFQDSEVIRNNPYVITKIKGVGFQTADDIGKYLGIPRDSVLRVCAGVMHCLNEAAWNEGHCCLSKTEIIKRCSAILRLEINTVGPIIIQNLEILEKDGKIKCPPDNTVALTWLHRCETAAAKRVLEFTKRAAEIKNLDSEIDAAAQRMGIRFTAEQRQAVVMASTAPISIVTGAPGVGKTAIVKAILEVCHLNSETVALCCPTGKARKRLEELTNYPACTIHRLLEWRQGKFTRTVARPLDVDVVICDECFDYKQPILTENGWDYIGRIVNRKERIKVWSHNKETGQLELKPILRWLKRDLSDKRMLAISASRSNSTRASRLIKCTDSHKILTENGYIRAADLRVGDYLVCKDWSPSKEQKSILIGSLFGDGSLSYQSYRTSPQFSIMHGEDQIDYLKFKHNAFYGHSSDITESKSGYCDKKVFSFNVNISDFIYELASMKKYLATGKRRRWSPSDGLISMIDAQSLAIWYMDDGSIASYYVKSGDKKYTAYIHSNQFTENDNIKICQHLYNAFGIKAKPRKVHRGFYRIAIPSSETKLFFDTISPYIPKCMSYKTDGRECCYEIDHRTVMGENTVLSPIKSIKPWRSKYPSVYDIEVEDNHNYIAGNIIVSNCSMADVSVFSALIAAMKPDTRLVLVGDADQLPSVGPGNVLRDLIWSGCCPVTRLMHIFRQREGSEIAEVARLVNQGILPRDLGFADNKEFRFLSIEDHYQVVDSIAKIYEESCETYGQDQVQVIVPMRKGVVGTEALNTRLQRVANPRGRETGLKKGGYVFRIGDRIMFTRNDYENDVFNGDMGVLVASDYGESTISIDGREVIYGKDRIANLEPGYCVTIHKSQGSQYSAVICGIVTAHFVLLDKNLFYTAITRAAKQVTVVGQNKALFMAVKRDQAISRHTRLRQILQEN